MQAYFQNYLSSFQDAVAGLDQLLAMLVSFYPQSAEKLQADRVEFNNYLLRARKLFQNPLFLPFHMISFFFLLRDFEKRSEQCAREVTRIAEEEEMVFSDEELEMSDEEILALFNIPASYAHEAEDPLPNPAYAGDPLLNPMYAGDPSLYSVYGPEPSLNPPHAGVTLSWKGAYQNAEGVKHASPGSAQSAHPGFDGSNLSCPEGAAQFDTVNINPVSNLSWNPPHTGGNLSWNPSRAGGRGGAFNAQSVLNTWLGLAGEATRSPP